MAAPNGPPDQQEIPAKSGPSSVPSFLRFINRTPRLVDVIWLNYDGIRIRYKTLPPNGYVDVNTFVGHPWFFRDRQTGEKMVVRSSDVYLPEGHPPGSVLRRRLINITIPVYTLRERCLQTVRRLWTHADIEVLDIPDILKRDLLRTTPLGMPIMGAYIQHSGGQHIVQVQQPPPAAENHPAGEDGVQKDGDDHTAANESDDDVSDDDVNSSDDDDEDEEEDVPGLLDTEDESSNDNHPSPAAIKQAPKDSHKDTACASYEPHKSSSTNCSSSSCVHQNSCHSSVSSSSCVKPNPCNSNGQIPQMGDHVTSFNSKSAGQNSSDKNEHELVNGDSKKDDAASKAEKNNNSKCDSHGNNEDTCDLTHSVQ